ncbi:AAA family ATPase [Synechococcus sp. H55.11]|uniref:AAA family ATPase n=1 Tax=Synechococcus sp. H55.11 TaxID=2967121 RepID=UPI0039C02933
MRILSLALQNFKSHEDAIFTFEPGINAICGENGAGKTSILEAIAWVLFDYCPYSQEEIIRSGASDAVVTVQFISQWDQRTYDVRRSVSQGYRLFDPQLKQRLEYERKSDVLPWLRQHLGVPAGTDLARLFATTIGVPQGTFTADFLKTGRDRKEVFDRILKVEEYQQVAKDLLAVEKYSEAQVQAIHHQIELLRQQLQEWDPLQTERQKIQQELGHWQGRLSQSIHTLDQAKIEIERLEKLLEQIQTLDHRIAQLEQKGSLLDVSLKQAEKLWEEARQAQAQQQQYQEGSQRFLAIEAQLRELEKQQQQRLEWLKQRDALLLQKQNIENQLARLQEKLSQQQRWKQELEELTPQIQAQEELEHQQIYWTQQLNTLLQLHHEWEQLRAAWTAHAQRCQLLQDRVQEAEQAQVICQQHQTAHNRYLELEALIADQEALRQARQTLLAQRETLQHQLHQLELRGSEYQHQLQIFQKMAAEKLELQPLCEQQTALEQRHFQISQKLASFQTLCLELKQRETEQEQGQVQLEQLQLQLRQRQADLDRVAAIPTLEAQQERLQTQLSRIAAARQFQQELQAIFEQGSNRFAQQHHSIQQLLSQLEAQQHNYPQLQPLWQRIPEVLAQSSALSQQLLQSIHHILQDLAPQTSEPQLHQQLADIQKQLRTLQPLLGLTAQIPDLEAQVERLLQLQAERQSQIDDLHWSLEAEPTFLRQQQEIGQALQALGDPKGQIQRLEKELNGKPRVEQEYQQLTKHIHQLQQQLENLERQLEPLRDLEDRIADLREEQKGHRSGYETVIRLQALAQSLPQRKEELKTAQALLEQLQKAGQEKQAQIGQWESAQGSRDQLQAQIEKAAEALKSLGDPRSQAERLKAELKQEKQYLQMQAECLQQLRDLEATLGPIDEALSQTEHLDRELGSLQKQRERYRLDHEHYLRAEPIAKLLPEREQKLAELSAQQQELQAQLSQLRLQRDPLAALYQPQEHERLRALLQTTQIQKAEAQARLESLAPQLSKIQERLRQLEQVRESLKQVEAEKNEKERLHRFIKFSRDTYKKAGPQVTQHYLQQINDTADHLFREILNRSNITLTWETDYEIWVQEAGSRKRRFASLSGGEQMSAALAVRLALLKVLGQLDIAFFDEPTTNMDAQRRQRLAEAITNLRSFQQLFVISHDDTFEQVTENIIRVERHSGSDQMRRDPTYGV